ncbi:hypothetical protein ACFV2U_02275 [Streptomyces sp. NPDC059697]|uniref:hypothetical protein n=1 Tax=Streptomyces sp. NPDC059697 TaxID=3346912 RepID=UPI0036A8C0F3
MDRGFHDPLLVEADALACPKAGEERDEGVPVELRNTVRRPAQSLVPVHDHLTAHQPVHLAPHHLVRAACLTTPPPRRLPSQLLKATVIEQFQGRQQELCRRAGHLGVQFQPVSSRL